MARAGEAALNRPARPIKFAIGGEYPKVIKALMFARPLNDHLGYPDWSHGLGD